MRGVKHTLSRHGDETINTESSEALISNDLRYLGTKYAGKAPEAIYPCEHLAYGGRPNPTVERSELREW